MFNLYRLEEVDTTGCNSLIWVEELSDADVGNLAEANAYLAGCNRGAEEYCIVDDETNTILYKS